MPLSREDHFDRSRRPKRILALDGGGIRGVLSLEYLALIEDELKKRTGRADFVLADYFDLIGGTSTGAILAACLAVGKSVADLKALYRDLGGSVFKGSFWHRGILSPKFEAEPLHHHLETQLGADTTLDSPRIRTGLMVMTKRLDTGSPWPLHNHPGARYHEQDGKLRLTEVVRASTAAPTYFEPQRITISSRDGSKVDGAFVDGGASPYNDPSLQLLMLAALDGHGLRWQTGRDNILLISVGTGAHKTTYSAEKLLDMKAAEQGLRSLLSLMDDCTRMNHVMLQWLTRCLTPWTLDRAVGDMQIDSEAGPQLATYARYNVLLDQKWLTDTARADYAADQLKKIAAMDDPSHMKELSEIGALVARLQVKPEHLPPEFDVA
jgi:patatin-like phospholipase